MLTATAFYAPIQAITMLVDTLYLLDERLVSINKVMDNVNLTEVFESATESAYKYGQTIDETLKSIEEIGKLGFNQADAQALSGNAMLLSTVGEFKNNADAANYLVAIMRQYKLEVEDTTKVVDALNEVSNKTGADTVGLSQALSKASSSAANAGVSFDEFLGMVSSTIETLKISGNEAGTFYKALFTRMNREDTIKEIEALGVATKNSSGEMLSATEILQNLGVAYEGLDQVARSSLAESLGGVWHSNKVMTLLQNQDQVLKNTTVSMNSYGSASKELEGFSEGLAFKTNVMKASFQELAMVIGQNGVRDGLVALIEMVTSMTQGFTELTEATNGWNLKLPILIALGWGAVKMFNAIKISILGIRSAFGIFSIGIVALELLTSAFMGSAKASEMNTQALMESAQKTSDNRTELERLISKYNELEPLAKNNADKQKELQEVLQQINRLAPHLIESTGKYGNELYLNKEKADIYIASLKEMTEEQLKQAQLANSIELSGLNVDIDEAKQKLGQMESSVKETYEKIQSYQSKYNVSGLLDAEEEFQKRRTKLYKESDDAFKKGNDELAGQLLLNLRELENEHLQYTMLMKDSGGELSEYSKKVADMQELEGKKDGLLDREKALQDMVSGTKRSTDENQANAESIQGLEEGYEGLEESIEGANEKSLSFAETLADTSKFAELLSSSLYGVTQGSVDETKNLISAYEQLSVITNRTAEQQQLYDDVLAEIQARYPQVVQGSEVRIEMLMKEAEANEIILEAVEKSANGQLDAEGQKTLATAQEAKSRLAILSTEMKMLRRALEFHEKSAKIYQNIASESGMLTDRQAQMLVSHQEGMSSSQIEINKLYAEIDKATSNFDGSISSLADNIDYSGRVYGDYIGKQEKSKKETKEQIYITDKYKNAIEKLNTELAKLKEYQTDLPKWSDEYQKSLKKEIQLLEKQTKLKKEQADLLAKQIKSGKIKPTGMVDLGSSSVASIPVSTSSSRATGGGNSSTIWNFFKSKGFSDAIVAGIMGNLQLESGLNPNALNGSSGAYGIAQWLGGRKSALRSFASSSGTSMSDINTQLNFLWKELNSTESRTMNYLKNNQFSSASAIAAAFDKLFERSEGTHIPQRQQYANQFLSQFGGKNGSVPAASISSSGASSNNSAAEMAQAIDQARSDYNGLMQDIYSMEDQIQEIRFALVNAELDEWSHKIDRANQLLEAHELKLSKLDPTSQAYTDELKKQLNTLTWQQKSQNELAWRTEHAAKKAKGLTQEQREALMDRYYDEMNALNQIRNQVAEIQQLIVDTKIETWKEQFNDIDVLLERIELKLSKMNPNSEQYRKELEKQKKLLVDQRKLQNDLVWFIGYQIKNNKNLTEAQRQELKDRYEEELNYLEEVRNSVEDVNQAIINSGLDEMFEKINKSYEKLSDTLEDLNDELDLVQAKGNESNKEEMDVNSEILTSLTEKRKTIQDTIADLEKQKSSLKGNEEAVKKVTEEIERWEDELDNVEDSILQTALTIKEGIVDSINSRYEKQIADIEKNIDSITESYDKQIEQQQEKLKLLDEEYEKEDRLKELRDINDEISKTKADKRFEFINSKGQVELTYDKARVSELEKQRDETLKQYQREDVKQAIQNEIERLEKAKKDKEDLYRKEIETLKELQKQEIDAVNLHWQNLITAVQNGTLSYDELMNGKDGFFAKSLEGMSKYGDGVAEEVARLQSLFAQLLIAQQNISNTPPPSQTVPAETKVEGNLGGYAKKVTVVNGKLVAIRPPKQFHDGGIIGHSGSQAPSRLTELVNKLFNVKPGEEIVKSLVGEVQIPPKNLMNGITNIRNMASSLVGSAQQTLQPIYNTYSFPNMKVEANDMNHFIKSIEFHTRNNQ